MAFAMCICLVCFLANVITRSMLALLIASLEPLYDPVVVNQHLVQALPTNPSSILSLIRQIPFNGTSEWIEVQEHEALS